MAVIEPLHIINAFETAIRGSERAALAIARLLAPRCQVNVWSTVPLSHAVRSLAGEFGTNIREIRPFGGEFPKGGTLLFWGTHYRLGMWLSAAQARATAILSETYVYGSLYRHVLQIRTARLPEPSIIYVSDLLKRSALLPGGVLYPLPDMAPFLALERVRGRRPFTAGRVSRDTPEKHHADDPALYQALAAAGIRIRILGGTCLAARMGPHPLIELLPQGSVPVTEFLPTIDAFVYRTGFGNGYVEPSGVAFAEAMAAGLPVVCGRPGGYEDLVDHGRTGFVAESQEKMRDHLLSLRDDPELEARIGAAARASVADYFGPGYADRFFGLLWPG